MKPEPLVRQSARPLLLRALPSPARRRPASTPTACKAQVRADVESWLACDFDIPDDMAEALLARRHTDRRRARRRSSPGAATSSRRWSPRSGRRSGRDAAFAIIPSVARPTGGAWYEGSDLRALAASGRHHRGLLLRAERRAGAGRRLGRQAPAAAARARSAASCVRRIPDLQSARRGRGRGDGAARRPASPTSPSTITDISGQRSLDWIGAALATGELSDVDFTGKVVAITGAAGGIGQALCRHFGGQGANDRRDRPDRGGHGIRRRPSPGRASRRKPAVARHRRRRGGERRRLPISRSRSARSTSSSTMPASRSVPTLERTTPADLAASDVDGNLNGAYYCAHAVLPAMKARGGGVIVNIGSVNGFSTSAIPPTAPPRPA